MDINDKKYFFNLCTNELANLNREQVVSRRRSLLNVVDAFFPLNNWPSHMIKIFWNKPISDMETFQLFLFFFGNGGSPDVIGRWILSSQSWADETKYTKRARQLDYIRNNLVSKNNIWFYFDLILEDWRFLNGNKRKKN